MASCADCFFYSDGANQIEGAGFCYANADYVEPEGHCKFHAPYQRVNPETGAPWPPVNEPEATTILRK